MMELEYIPLKTAEGVACGHAKVRSGAVELSLRAGRTGEAVVLTDGGSFTGSPGARIHTAGRVQAVAVREGDAIRCCGLARRSAYTLAEVRLRLSAQTAERKKPPARPERSGVPGERFRGEAEPPRGEAVLGQPEKPVKKAAPPEPPEEKTVFREVQTEGLAEDGLPFHPDTAIKQALSRLAEETAAAFLEDVHPEPVLPEQMPAAPCPLLPGEPQGPEPNTLEDTAADTEAFSALMARADAVFTKIDTPLAQEEGEGWCGAVDRLVQGNVRETGRIPVQNPFPHIFPGARFAKETGDGAGALRGEWMSGRERMTITAVRGDYSPRPPEELPGFTRYIRARSGGYWVKVDDGET